MALKLLAMIDLKPGSRMETVRSELANEIKGCWELYLSGVLREVYATAIPTRVIFVLETDDVAAAQRHFAKLPFVVEGLLHIEWVELRPFANWSKLFRPTS
jgi:hypothetical protein